MMSLGRGATIRSTWSRDRWRPYMGESGSDTAISVDSNRSAFVCFTAMINSMGVEGSARSPRAQRTCGTKPPNHSVKFASCPHT